VRFGAKKFFKQRKRPARVAGLSDISKKGGKLITAKSANMKKPEVFFGIKRLFLVYGFSIKSKDEEIVLVM
jgi:hypothetical protein